MTKDRRRKGKLRSNKPTPIDDELAQLASVISEYQLDNNAYGWFRPAWRDGHWAIGLATAAARVSIDGFASVGAERDAFTFLNSLDSSFNDATCYEKAGAIYNALVQPKINTDSARLLAAALRCTQLRIARSDGGGAVYNEILIPAFLPLEPQHVADLVLEFRCNDAIGSSHHLRGDRNDRQRSAFTIAWRRGLYLAAYAIPKIH